jgi:hypothetical protein
MGITRAFDVLHAKMSPPQQGVIHVDTEEDALHHLNRNPDDRQLGHSRLGQLQ